MLPFEVYPERGRALLGPIRGSNCRKGYGLKLMRVTGQTCCAYCGISLVEPYTNWLQMAVDHVVPRSVCRGFALSSECVQVPYFPDTRISGMTVRQPLAAAR